MNKSSQSTFFGLYGLKSTEEALFYDLLMISDNNFSFTSSGFSSEGFLYQG